MEEILKDWKKNAKKNEERNFKFLTRLKLRSNQRKVDTTANALHKEAFEKIDCLQCGNCCKTISPLVNNDDLNRISTVLKMSKADFTKKYLEKDQDGDLKIKTLPCPFLGEDNYCSIYEDRPKDCREFPHTDKKGFSSRRYMHSFNTLDCPAVFYIVEQLRRIV